MKLTLENIPGKVILVGYTYVDDDGNAVEQRQFWGRVESADDRGIHIRCSDGQRRSIPPSLQSTKIAAPGTYRLRSTGETIENPDLLSTWIVRSPGK